MGCSQSKEEPPPPPAPEIRWKSDRQAKVIQALHSIHQERETRLVMKIKNGKAYGKKDFSMVSWYGRPITETGDENAKNDGVFKTHKRLMKTKGNGRFDQRVPYGHSQIHLELKEDIESIGLDAVFIKWFKPGTWIDEFRVDLDLKSFKCNWTLPNKNTTPAKKGGRASNTEDTKVGFTYPPDFNPVSFKVSFDGETTEYHMEKTKKEYKFFYGNIQPIRPGLLLFTVVTEHLLGPEDDRVDIEDFPIKIQIDLKPPPSVVEDGSNVDRTKRPPRGRDTVLETKNFRSLIDWQRPLPRSFIPDAKPYTLIRLEVARSLTCKRGVWEIKNVPEIKEDPSRCIIEVAKP